MLWNPQLIRTATQMMELTCITALQRAEQNPFARANHILGQQFHTANIHPQCQICQFLLQIPGGIGHDQSIPGTGHSHIQHTHLLAEALGCCLGADGSLGNGRIANTVLGICHRQAQTQLLVAKNLGTQTFPVKLTA